MRHQRLTNAFTALCRANEKVLQIDAGAAAEGRKIDEPDREAGRLALPTISQNSRGLAPNKAASMSASVASTSWSSFS
jgi:hypothetical protein